MSDTASGDRINLMDRSSISANPTGWLQEAGGRHGRWPRRRTSQSSQVSHSQTCGLIGGASARLSDRSAPSTDTADTSETRRSRAVYHSADRDPVPSAGRDARLIDRLWASASLNAPTGAAAPRAASPVGQGPPSTPPKKLGAARPHARNRDASPA